MKSTVSPAKDNGEAIQELKIAIAEMCNLLSLRSAQLIAFIEQFSAPNVLNTYKGTGIREMCDKASSKLTNAFIKIHGGAGGKLLKK
jgi:hypothetical protein